MAEQNKDTYQKAFEEEARELLSELETALLELEKNPADRELIARVFRAMHTIKGSGAMFGYQKIAEFTHEVETVFDRVRNGALAVSQELIDLTLMARDHIRFLLDGAERSSGAPDPELIVTSLRKLAAVKSPAEGAAPDQESTFRIFFRPPVDIAFRGIDPTRLLEELRSLGHCTITPRTRALPSLDDMNPESCYLMWDVILSTTRGIDAIKDVFLFVQDDSELKIVATLDEQQHLKALQERKQATESHASIRVTSEKLDKLVDLVGELVTIQSLLSEVAQELNKTRVPAIAEAVERLTTELRDTTMGIRMLPIGTTFSKFNRLVRDLSKELGKEILLETEGAETELDKTVIEKLNDPLVHILRNSIDHGIESPEARVKAGKPRSGTVRLIARHSGAHVVIQIEDDGKGLDPDAIRTKAVENGMIAPDANLPTKELFSLIFAPGFSTAKAVTSVSGRGVGMDVVKRAIDGLEGGIEINSRKDVGTTITLKIPLTLAIIEGLLVKVGKESLVMPLSVVEECVELIRSQDLVQAQVKHGRNLANVRGQIVPYIRLRDHLMLEGEQPPIEQVVITRIEGQRVGFVVDRVLGSHQTVIKNLGTMFKKIDGISGGTILGDGSVALILDLAKLKETVEHEDLRSALVRDDNMI